MTRGDCLRYCVPAADASLIWNSFSDAGAFITKANGQPFAFAAGSQATLKIDADRLNAHPKIIGQLLSIYRRHPCVIAADTLSFVPNGAAFFAVELARALNKPLIKLIRPDGAERSDIRFVGHEDTQLAAEARRVCLLEDISNTGLSAFWAAAVLWQVNASLAIHTVSMLQRSDVDDSYAQHLVYHTLLRRDVPLTVEEFVVRFPGLKICSVN